MSLSFLKAFDIMQNDHNKVIRLSFWKEKQYLYLNDYGLLYCHTYDDKADVPYIFGTDTLQHLFWEIGIHPSKKLVTFCEMLDKVLNNGKTARKSDWPSDYLVYRSIHGDLKFNQSVTCEFINIHNINSMWIILD